MVSVLIELN